MLKYIGYKYTRRKIMFFISKSGVEDILNGGDDRGDLCTRNVPRPALISRYFKDSSKMDNHN